LSPSSRPDPSTPVSTSFELNNSSTGSLSHPLFPSRAYLPSHCQLLSNPLSFSPIREAVTQISRFLLFLVCHPLSNLCVPSSGEPELSNSPPPSHPVEPITFARFPLLADSLKFKFHPCLWSSSPTMKVKLLRNSRFFPERLGGFPAFYCRSPPSNQ